MFMKKIMPNHIFDKFLKLDHGSTHNIFQNVYNCLRATRVFRFSILLTLMLQYYYGKTGIRLAKTKATFMADGLEIPNR